ncbi:unnamed protein product [Darwinula stevensoni]|uniref:C2H2-type domain-containing protein n=1 Tax=Darwinula stevensoni TaxID=69355 RepID=A0A7R9AD57_9CRUS|nr:unnamed protein product [Darwinula stevensoni]CAG0900451.1 unnamed protein product [Darwinula stevensoni]
MHEISRDLISPLQTIEGVSPLVWTGKTRDAARLHFCGRCGYRAPARTKLVRHVRMHTGERPYTCGECGRSFCQKAHLTRHRIGHITLL